METQIRAKRFGGSIGVIIPREIVERERIQEDDTLEINVKKIANLDFLWGAWRDVKKPTQRIMEEIDEGEE